MTIAALGKKDQNKKGDTQSIMRRLGPIISTGLLIPPDRLATHINNQTFRRRVEVAEARGSILARSDATYNAH